MRNSFVLQDYHQDFYKKNIISSTKYKYYRNASGRDDYIDEHWSDKSVQLNLDRALYQTIKPRQMHNIPLMSLE